MDLAFLKYVFACARDEMHEGYRVVSGRKAEGVESVRRRSLEKPTVEGDSPVIENMFLSWILSLSTTGHV